MKNLLFISISFILSGCFMRPQTKEEVCQHKIQEWLSKNLKDPDSYSPIKFYPLVDNNTTPPDTSKQAIDLYMANLEYRDALIDIDNHMDRNHNGYYDKRRKEYADSLMRAATLFKPKKTGYFIYHSYRAKNGFGGLDVFDDAFFFDLNYNIVDVKQNQF